MSQELRKIIAENVCKYRDRKNYTRERLSIVCELDTSYISKLEKGHVNITIDTLEKIANILEIDISKLFE